MTDVRQGPLPVWADPFSTSAERCVAGILDPVAPMRGPMLTDPHPHVIAYRGFVPADGWPRAYYLDGDVWRDTLTDEVWSGHLPEQFAANWAGKFDLRTKVTP